MNGSQTNYAEMLAMPKYRSGENFSPLALIVDEKIKFS
jgi:hypothetical protein